MAGIEGGASGFQEYFRRFILQFVTRSLAQSIAQAFIPTGALGGRAATGAVGFIQSLFGGRREFGGPVCPNRGYLVGEGGPEFFFPTQPGQIIPNGGRGGSIQVSAPVTLVGDVDVATQRAMARRARFNAGLLAQTAQELRLQGGF